MLHPALPASSSRKGPVPLCAREQSKFLPGVHCKAVLTPTGGPDPVAVGGGVGVGPVLRELPAFPFLFICFLIGYLNHVFSAWCGVGQGWRLWGVPPTLPLLKLLDSRLSYWLLSFLLLVPEPRLSDFGVPCIMTNHFCHPWLLAHVSPEFLNFLGHFLEGVFSPRSVCISAPARVPEPSGSLVRRLPCGDPHSCLRSS